MTPRLARQYRSWSCLGQSAATMSSSMRLSTVRRIYAQPWLANGTPPCHARKLHVDGRARLSNEWIPSIKGIASKEDEDAHTKLLRAGFLRQSHSGVFHLLPLGLRVQDKITRLIDRYMRGLGASRVQMSAISSEALWEKSARLNKIGSELFRFQDRKDGRYLLGPTHEEEITTMIAQPATLYKMLPLRIYQITQKYRDELRPRHGLLRGRDFCMKDLYTFDYSVEGALKTYEEVREAYSHIFIKEMKLPVLVAEASSGDMGGTLSHEYHIPTSYGEDHVISCNKCDYVANEEVARTREPEAQNTPNSSTAADSLQVWRSISKDRKTIVNVWYSAKSPRDINTHAVKKVFPDLDTSIGTKGKDIADKVGSKHPEGVDGEKIKVINLVDSSFSHQVPFSQGEHAPEEIASHDYLNSRTANFLRMETGDPCPSCSSGTLTVQEAIELGHTFHLGTRYSEPLAAYTTVPRKLLEGTASSTTSAGSDIQSVKVPLQMGCHGIGISRIIGAVANHLVDARGLNWPRVIAPYEVALIYNDQLEAAVQGVTEVYDAIATGEDAVDAVIDDRVGVLMVDKLFNADLVGYPVLVVLGKEWSQSGRVELQCRRLGVKDFVPLHEVRSRLLHLLQKL